MESPLLRTPVGQLKESRSKELCFLHFICVAGTINNVLRYLSTCMFQGCPYREVALYINVGRYSLKQGLTDKITLLRVALWLVHFMF